MKIEFGEPWLLWPDTVSYGINKGDIGDVFEGDSDFTINLRIKINTQNPVKRTVFAKLPNYMGFDVEGENNNPLFIFNYLENGETKADYIFINRELGWGWNMVTIRYNHNLNKIDFLINGIVEWERDLQNNKLSRGDGPHILFGSGNFPHNGFNLNYCEYEIDHLLISKNFLYYDIIDEIYNTKRINEKQMVVGLYDFKEKTDYKIYDFTGNCNFIHKILN